MSKVMHKPNFKSSHLSKHFNSLLHRGQKSKDPYNNKRLSLGSVGLLLKTLGTGSLSTRCSSTFNSDSKFNNYINNSKNLRIAGISSLIVLLTLSTLFIYPVVKNLNTAEAVTPKNSTTTLNITTGASANVKLLVQGSSGTFAKSDSSDRASFSVTTDNYAGYNLIIKGKDSNYNKLTNSSTNTSLTSISGSMTETNFKNSSSNGIWGYLPSKLNSSTNTNYKGAPNNNTGDTIDKTSAPATSVTDANSYTIGLGVKADYSTKAGTYTNTYVLTATGNDTPFTVTYGKTTTDAVSFNGGTLPSTLDYATSTTSITLSSAVPTRTGYTFLRWCDGTVSNNDTSCSGTTYNAGATYNIDRTSATNSVTLYAVWSPTITIKANTGISNVKLNNGTACTNTSSGCTVTGLEYGKSYNLVAALATGYNFSSWSRSSTTSTGSIASTSSASTTYTVGSYPVTITPSAALKTYSLAITFAGEGVSSVKVCKTSGDCSGSNLMGTATTSGNSVSGLAYNTAYYLYPSFSSNYELDSWAKTSSYGTLSSTSAANPTFTMGLGDGAVTVTSKVSIDGYLQDFTASECSAMSTGDVKRLGDKRDGNVYNIAKLGNNNCWMTQNLRYIGDAGSTDGVMIMKSETSNIDADRTIAYQKVTAGGSYTEARLYVATNALVPSDVAYTATDMGVWYNYPAVSAMTIAVKGTYDNTIYDICPRGWRLPTVFERFDVSGSSDIFAPVTGGSFIPHYISSRNNGYWWTATNVGNSLYHYALVYDGDNLNISSTGRDRMHGLYARCIKKTASEETVKYLQEMTTDIANSLDTGTVITLIDRRDEQAYQAARLADGNLWMIDNLNLNVATMDLTSDNTNCATANNDTNCVATGLNNAILNKDTFNSWGSNGVYSSTEAGYNPVRGVDLDANVIYGTLYNYCATSAGTYCMYRSESTDYRTQYDICPKNWRLPTDADSWDELPILYKSYGAIDKAHASVADGGAALTYAGWYTDSLQRKGSDSRYWSSDRAGWSSTYVLLFSTSSVTLSDYTYGGRGIGASVRCIFKNSS